MNKLNLVTILAMVLATISNYLVKVASAQRVAPGPIMANGWHNTAKVRCWHGAAGEVDIVNDEIVVMAFEDVTGYDLTDEFVAGGGDVLDRAGVTEVTSTGYTGGFGGADRLTMVGPGITVDQGNNRAEYDVDDITWTAISQNAAETWVGFLFLSEITSDALSPALFHIDTATGLPLTPNGSDITITVDAEGLAQIT